MHYIMYKNHQFYLTGETWSATWPKGLMAQNTLVLFSKGLITKEEAVEKLGFRDYAELLIALGEVDLPIFTLPEEELEKQANLLAELLSQRWLAGSPIAYKSTLKR